MTIVTFLAAIAMQSLPAPTLPDWQRIGGDAAGEYAVWPQSIRRSGSEVSAIIRIDVTRGARTGARIFGVIRYVYDCAANTSRMEEGDLYDANLVRLGAAPLSPEHRTNAPVPPGTPTASVRDYLCARPRQ